MNPIAFLLVSLAGTSAMLAVIFLIAWLDFGRRPHALAWAVAFAIATLQWLLNLSSQSLFDNRDAYWLVVNATQIATVSLALLGFRQRAGRANPRLAYLVPGLLAWIAVAWFTLGARHEGLRTSIGTFYAAGMLALCVPAILRHRSRPLPAEWGTALVTALFALLQAAAAVAALSGGGGPDAGARQLYTLINFVSMPAAYTGMGLFTVLLLASDMSEAMRTLALNDSLTGLLNRRGFDDAASRHFAAAQRSGGALAVIVGDLDHFKAINDRHGHAAGDRALRAFAHCLRNNARPSDVVGRTGGEEFALVLPGTTAVLAAEIAERLRATVAGQSIAGHRGTIAFRASFGVAALEPGDGDLGSLMQRADRALYQAKQRGRDRVVTFGGHAGEGLPLEALAGDPA